MSADRRYARIKLSSLLDPRLNRAQSLEISLFIIQEVLKKVDYSLYLTLSHTILPVQVIKMAFILII